MYTDVCMYVLCLLFVSIHVCVITLGPWITQDDNPMLRFLSDSHLQSPSCHVCLVAFCLPKDIHIHKHICTNYNSTMNATEKTNDHTDYLQNILSLGKFTGP